MMEIGELQISYGSRMLVLISKRFLILSVFFYILDVCVLLSMGSPVRHFSANIHGLGDDISLLCPRLVECKVENGQSGS